MTTNFFVKSFRLLGLAAVTLLPGMACSYSVTSPAIGAGGGYVTMQVFTQPTCAWQIAEASPFVFVTTARSGRGNGAVTLYLSANPGLARTALVKGLVFVPPPGAARAGFDLHGATRPTMGSWQVIFQGAIRESGR